MPAALVLSPNVQSAEGMSGLVAPQSLLHEELASGFGSHGFHISSCIDAVDDLDTTGRPASARQIRVERRVMVRISPSSGKRKRHGFTSESSSFAPAPRYEEQRVVKCVGLDKINGVKQGTGNRLVLFLQNERPVSATLEKSCQSRDFYSGFYVESTGDGQICAGRDTLHSRSGSNCALLRLNRLNPTKD